LRPDRSEIASELEGLAPGESLSESPDDSLTIRYLGRLRIAVSGTFTGTLYQFSPNQSVQRVDARDAFSLLDSGLFGIAL
jgi:hypothetical protein